MFILFLRNFYCSCLEFVVVKKTVISQGVRHEYRVAIGDQFQQEDGPWVAKEA